MPSRLEVLEAWGERSRWLRAIGEEGAARLPFLCGQAAPRPVPGATHVPLFPYPNQSAGARLFKLSGWSLGLWMRAWDRFNTLPHFPGKAGRGDRFPVREAREAAARHVNERGLDKRWGVFVGAANARAYAWPGGCPDPFTPVEVDGGAQWLWVPHTSGLSPFWEHPENAVRMRPALEPYRQLVNLIPMDLKE